MTACTAPRCASAANLLSMLLTAENREGLDTGPAAEAESTGYTQYSLAEIRKLLKGAWATPV